MAVRKTELVNEEYYHILNRGVDKREIFMDDEDRYRFLRNLFEFNDENNIVYPFSYRNGTCWIPGIQQVNKQRKNIVDILCFCLMPNHFHLILKQLSDKGISKFMHKLGHGYSLYFNKKYSRSGSLFQGKFKSIHINSDSQLLHLSKYIHLLNPGKLIEPKIREGIIKDKDGLNDFMKKYKWSSYLDYIGIKNYPSLIKKDLLLSMFKDEKCYENFIMFELKEKDILGDMILE